MITVEQASQLINQHVKPLPVETVGLREAVGRVLTQAVAADVNSPPHDKSVMDGFAVRASDVQVDAEFEIVETIYAGAVPTVPLQSRQASRIMTGAPLPPNADAVVMVELSQVADDQKKVRFDLASLAAERHVLRTGANFASGQELFPAGHTLRAVDVGLLAEVGVHQLDLRRQPRVAVLPTGDELVDCSQVPGAGQIRNSNGPMLASMLRSAGAQVKELGIGRDQCSQLRRLIETGLQHDMLVLSGGVSAGQKDLVPDLLQSLGVVKVFHKVKVKPGKPIWFGILESKQQPTVVFGLPGNPVSSLVGFRLFVQQAIAALADGPAVQCWVMARLAEDHHTRGDRPTYWPGKWLVDGQSRRRVKPLPWNGSSDLMALGQADGLIYFPETNHHHPAEKEIQFYPF